MAIIFDKVNKLIVITSDQTEVTIQELINSIRDYEDEPYNMETASIANAYGKQDLGGETKVGITLELINNWRIKFEDRDPPDYIACTISGGNLVAINDYDNNPIKSSAYTQITISQSSSATEIETRDALSTEEHDHLMGVQDHVWDEILTEHLTPETTGFSLKLANSEGSLKSVPQSISQHLEKQLNP